MRAAASHLVRGQPMPYGGADVSFVFEPGSGGRVEPRDLGGSPARELRLEVLGEEVVVAIPLVALVERPDEEVLAGQIAQHLAGVIAPGHHAAEVGAKPLEDRGLEQRNGAGRRAAARVPRSSDTAPPRAGRRAAPWCPRERPDTDRRPNPRSPRAGGRARLRRRARPFMASNRAASSRPRASSGKRSSFSRPSARRRASGISGSRRAPITTRAPPGSASNSISRSRQPFSPTRRCPSSRTSTNGGAAAIAEPSDGRMVSRMGVPAAAATPARRADLRHPGQGEGDVGQQHDGVVGVVVEREPGLRSARSRRSTA